MSLWSIRKLIKKEQLRENKRASEVHTVFDNKTTIWGCCSYSDGGDEGKLNVGRCTTTPTAVVGKIRRTTRNRRRRSGGGGGEQLMGPCGLNKQQCVVIVRTCANGGGDGGGRSDVNLTTSCWPVSRLTTRRKAFKG